MLSLHNYSLRVPHALSSFKFFMLKLFILSYTYLQLIKSTRYFVVDCRVGNLVTLSKIRISMVEGVGFEPTYSYGADLQSAAFNHSATLHIFFNDSYRIPLLFSSFYKEPSFITLNH